MRTAETDDTNDKSQKISPQSRPNYSKFGKLCDHTFYMQATSQDMRRNHVSFEVSPKKLPKQSTTAFTSVSRKKLQNLRFSIPLPVGQFSYYPDHTYGMSKSPRWSFPKKQRYENIKMKEYEICSKHPIAKSKQQDMLCSTSPMKETLKGNVAITKCSSMHDTSAEHNRNYSILLPRKTSAVEFFSKTKIKHPFYLSKAEIMNEEEKLQKNRQVSPNGKGYVHFFKKRPRQPNQNAKGLTNFLQNYSSETQYTNFSMTQHPTSPQYHIDFDRHLHRKFDARETKGPNMEIFNLDPIRVLTRNIDLNTKKFKPKIQTRYDRSQPYPNTRIDYNIPAPDLGGMVKMQKVIARNRELFPIIDPAIKKRGDREMRGSLRSCIPTKQINEAMRPKCNTRIQL